MFSAHIVAGVISGVYSGNLRLGSLVLNAELDEEDRAPCRRLHIGSALEALVAAICSSHSFREQRDLIKLNHLPFS